MFILLSNIVCVLVIKLGLQPVVPPHHLNEHFLCILKSFEKTWICHLKRRLVAVLQSGGLDLLFGVYKGYHPRATCKNEFTLILKDNLYHFVAVAK